MTPRKHLNQRICRAFRWLEDYDALYVAAAILAGLPPGAVHIEVCEAIDAMEDEKGST